MGARLERAPLPKNAYDAMEGAIGSCYNAEYVPRF